MMRLKTGSQPYDDNSGFRYDIEIIQGQGDEGPYMYLGYDWAMRVNLDEWEQLKSDIDKCIAAFNNLEPK